MAETTYLDLMLLEYEKLKDEQQGRIEYRDGLVNVTLIAIGAVFSYALSEKFYIGLLVLPFVTGMLGWSYHINDNKITGIRKYLQDPFYGNFIKLSKGPDSPVLKNWETIHLQDVDRKQKKIVQLLMDNMLFVVPGWISIGAFFIYSEPGQITCWSISFGSIEGLALAVLTFMFCQSSEIIIPNPKVSGGGTGS